MLHLVPDLLGREVDETSAGWSAQLDDGTRVPAEAFRRLACDCSLLAMCEDEHGDPLDVGRKTRKIPGALRRALAAIRGANAVRCWMALASGEVRVELGGYWHYAP